MSCVRSLSQERLIQLATLGESSRYRKAENEPMFIFARCDCFVDSSLKTANRVTEVNLLGVLPSVTTASLCVYFPT